MGVPIASGIASRGNGAAAGTTAGCMVTFLAVGSFAYSGGSVVCSWPSLRVLQVVLGVGWRAARRGRFRGWRLQCRRRSLELPASMVLNTAGRM